MELKYTTPVPEETQLEGFNRTFMELKCQTLTASIDFPGFQSYLYGIEIIDRACDNSNEQQFQSYLYGIEMKLMLLVVGTIASFNRTFMELKCYCQSNFRYRL